MIENVFWAFLCENDKNIDKKQINTFVKEKKVLHLHRNFEQQFYSIEKIYGNEKRYSSKELSLSRF